MNEPVVSFILVNYNGHHDTLEFLGHLPAMAFPYEVIVVDNGSKTNPEAELKAAYPWVRNIRSERNLGFAGGNNLGIKIARGRYFFFINNDTQLQAGTTEQLVEYLNDHSQTVGGVSPKICFAATGRIQYAGFTKLHALTARNRALGYNEEDRGQHDQIRRTPYLHGAAMMIPRRIVKEVGPMPEEYFLYYEELDWSERIRRAGYGLRYVPGPPVWHKASASTGAGSPLQLYYQTRNRLRFMRQFQSAGAYAGFLIYALGLVLPVRVLKLAARSQWKHVQALFRAVLQKPWPV